MSDRPSKGGGRGRGRGRGRGKPGHGQPRPGGDRRQRDDSRGHQHQPDQRVGRRQYEDQQGGDHPERDAHRSRGASDGDRSPRSTTEASLSPRPPQRGHERDVHSASSRPRGEPPTLEPAVRPVTGPPVRSEDPRTPTPFVEQRQQKPPVQAGTSVAVTEVGRPGPLYACS